MTNRRGLLALLRPPNVFTAFADSLAGLVVIRTLGVTVSDRDCALILVSGLLYLAGIVLNDVFDREVDARERPGRPLPSGQVSLRFATGLGLTFLGLGIAIGFWVSVTSGWVAVALAGAIVGYDGLLKNTGLRAISMGSCRAINFGLGLSPALAAGIGFSGIALAGPILLGGYITALTYIARDEVQGNTQVRARNGLAVMVGLLALAALAMLISPRLPASGWGWPFFAVLVYVWWAVWWPLWDRHDGPTTGRSIGRGIAMIPLIDATVCAVAGDALAAFAVASLALPAMMLKRWFSPT